MTGVQTCALPISYYSGSHAELFYEIMVSTNYPYRGAAADRAFDVLGAAASKRTAESDSADCDPVIVAAAAGAFSAVQVQSIRVGWDLDGDPARCKQ